jgi:DNA (cytosine-5)-methyltransferase 1
VACENVIEFATDWPLFSWWLAAMDVLGYTATVTCVSSAHIGDADNLPAPQWRDRVYVVFTKRGIRRPDLAPRPLARCVCDEDVQAVQWWKDPKRSTVGTHLIGKYRAQYLYRTPHAGRCARAIVEPYVRPALAVIDVTNIGRRIGDRKRPIVAATRARIARGIEMFYSPDDGASLGTPPLLVPSGGGRAERPMSVLAEPMRTQIANPRGFETLVTPPGFIAELRRNGAARPLTEPMATICAGGNHHALVIPYYSTGVAKSVLAPFDTLTVRDRFALVAPAIDIDDCYLRMVQPPEQLASQAAHIDAKQNERATPPHGKRLPTKPISPTAPKKPRSFFKH